MQRWLLHAPVQPLLHLCCWLPLGWLVAAAFFNALGANPAEALIRGTGDWALRLLCLSLAITPARKLLQQPALARWRRPLGLYAFFYACLHLLAYAWLDMGLELNDMAADIAKRPFILVGVLTFAVLLGLAATSPKAALRWLGGRRWQRWHRMVYGAAGLALLHFWWLRQGKNNFNEVWVYTGVVAVLLLARLPWKNKYKNSLKRLMDKRC